MQESANSGGKSKPLTQAEIERQARQERVAAALRANLHKRKEQARARAAGSAAPEDGAKRG
jgi:hypothetical protein